MHLALVGSLDSCLPIRCVLCVSFSFPHMPDMPFRLSFETDIIWKWAHSHTHTIHCFAISCNWCRWINCSEALSELQFRRNASYYSSKWQNLIYACIFATKRIKKKQTNWNMLSYWWHKRRKESRKAAENIPEPLKRCEYNVINDDIWAMLTGWKKKLA